MNEKWAIYRELKNLQTEVRKVGLLALEKGDAATACDLTKVEYILKGIASNVFNLALGAEDPNVSADDENAKQIIQYMSGRRSCAQEYKNRKEQ